MLIASAAEELKRQQREDNEITRRRNNAERSDGSTTLGPKGAFPSSAPPDVSAIAILAEMEDKRTAEEKTATPSSAEAGPGGEEIEDGDDEFPEEMGPRPRSMSEHVEKTVRRTVQPRQHQRRGSGISERWRSTVIGGSRDGVGSPLDVQCFTCTVGKKPSQAQKYVNDVDEVGGRECCCN